MADRDVLLSPRSDASPRAANFDRIARLYRWAEFLTLGPLLKQTRNALLPHILHTRQALVLGDGDGRFLAALLRRAPHLHAVAIDSSAAMLALLQSRCAFAGPRLSTRQGSVTPLSLTPDLQSTDLIATHFLLDCLSQVEVEDLTLQLAQTVRPSCLWAISEFGLPARQPFRFLARVFLRGLYLAFRALTGLRAQTLPDIGGALRRAGFRRVHQHRRLMGLLYSELWQLPPCVLPLGMDAAQLRGTASHQPTGEHCFE